jgi:hypothetical protein
MSNSDNSKPFLSILHYLGLLFATLCVIFGMLYITRGNDVTSIVMSLLVALCFFGVVQALIFFKAKANRKKISLPEIALLLVYLIITLLVSPVILHFLNTEFALKDKIKDIGNSKLNAIEQMVTDYEDQVRRDTALIRTTISTELTSYFNIPKTDFVNRGTYEAKLKSPPFNIDFSGKGLPDDLLKNRLYTQTSQSVASNYKRLTNILNTVKPENEAFVADARWIIDDWVRRRLNRTYYEIDDRMAENLEKLKAVKPDFDFQAREAEELPLDKPLDLIRLYQPNWLLSISMMLLLHFLLLAPYILIAGSGRIYPQSGPLGGTEY